MCFEPMVDLRRIFALTSILSLAIVYGVLWVQWMTTPEQYLSSDFIGLYAAGRTAANEGPSQVYNLVIQQKYQAEVLGADISQGELYLFAHPPFSILLPRLIVTSNFVQSFMLWDALMTVFFLLGLIPIVSVIKGNGISRFEWFVLISGVILFFPAFESLIIGQDSAFLYLGLCIWMYGILTDRDEAAGLGLSLAAIRPHIALLLAVPFLFKRRKVWWYFMLGCLGLGLFSLAYAGFDGIVGFLRTLFLSGSGAGYQLNESSMVNVVALLLRLFPFLSVDMVHLGGWVLYFLALTGLCFFWFHSDRIGGKQIGIAVLVSVFAAPHLHFHDLVALIVPLVGLMSVLLREGYWTARDVVLLPLAFSILLLANLSVHFSLWGTFYFAELLLLFGLMFPHRFGFRRHVWDVLNITR